MVNVTSSVRAYNWHAWWDTWVACNRNPSVMTIIEWDSNNKLYVINRQGQKFAAETWASKPESIRTGAVYRTYRKAADGVSRRRGTKGTSKDLSNSARAEFACTCHQASHT